MLEPLLYNFFVHMWVTVIYTNENIGYKHMRKIYHFTAIYLVLYDPIYIHLFGMAAMLFFCNGTLVIKGNIPKVFPVIILKYVVVLSPISILMI